MSWNQDNQRTALPVSTLLNQISMIAGQCRTELTALIGDCQTCQANLAPDATHSEFGRHGTDGTPRRDHAYMSLQRALAQVNQALVDVSLCRTEMSHSGGP